MVWQYQLQAARTAYLITRDHALAEGLVQSAFLRAFERIGQFDPQQRFGPWFLRSVVNAALQAVTRCERHISLDTRPNQTLASLAERLPDPSLSLDLTASRPRRAARSGTRSRSYPRPSTPRLCSATISG